VGSNPLAAAAPAVATSRIVNDLQSTVSADRVELDLDAEAFPRDAVYAAAFTFIDRCYVRLDQPVPGRIGISLRAKTGGALDAAAAAAELENELLAQSWRQRISDEGSELTASIVAGAFSSAAAAPGVFVDDLLGADGAAFDDPLGIALSWEEKYTKKTADAGGAALEAGAAAVEEAGSALPVGEGEQGT